MHWALQAKCRNLPPEMFEVENLTPGREEVEAQRLCHGCAVIPECADDALKSVSVSHVLRMLSKDDPENAEDMVPQLGMVRAGLPMRMPKGYESELLPS